MELQLTIDSFLASAGDSKDAKLLRGLSNPWSGQFQKSRESAESWRLAGNIFYKKRNFKAALECYNSSICYSPLGTDHLALAFGCRSAVYCEMNEHSLALKNIKWARESGYPAEKMLALEAREKKCKKMRKLAPDGDFDANSFFKLSYPQNKQLPFMIGGLKLCRSQDYGRYIISTKELKTGDVISIEKPAFVWPSFLTGPVCSFCSRTNSGSLLPCSHCALVMFCSEECKKKEALRHINEEQSKADSGTFAKGIEMQREAVRIAGGKDKLFDLLKDCDEKTVFDFDLSNPNDPSFEKNKLVALNGLCRNWNPLIKFNSDQEVLSNAFDYKSESTQERKKLLKFAINQLDICSVNWQALQDGRGGIFLLKSLLNHSCLPNIFSIQFGDKLALVVARPIKAGEQLFISYGALATIHTKPERAVMLKDYSFKCYCEACKRNYPRQLSQEDHRFKEPKSTKVSPKEAIDEFKNNCSYIDKKHDKNWPCYEISRLIDRNISLLQSLADH